MGSLLLTVGCSAGDSGKQVSQSVPSTYTYQPGYGNTNSTDSFTKPTSAPQPAATFQPVTNSVPSTTTGPITAPSSKPLLAKTDTSLRQSASFEQQTQPRVEPTPKPNSKSFYFSYDDSASTSAVELTKSALQNNRLPSASWARPWEFFNFERFDNATQEKTGLFKISMGLWNHPAVDNPNEKVYEVGVYMSAPEIKTEERKPLNLTVLLDLSGFYQPATADQNQLEKPVDLMRLGLRQLVDSLKPGDRVTLMQSGERPTIPLDNWAFDAKDLFPFTRVAAERDVNTPGFLKNGLEAAYKQALRNFDPNKMNRVLLLTDVSAPDTSVNMAEMSKNTRINNQEGIYFSAIGLGGASDKLLNTLSEAGSGAYFTVLTKNDAQRAFKERFIALMDIAAKQVTFRLDFPALLKRKQSAAEQSSVKQTEVLPTNFSYNTSQFFWESFGSDKDAADLMAEEFKLWVFYLDPRSREQKIEVVEKTLGGLLNAQLDNIKDAHLIYLLTSVMKGETSPEKATAELDKLFTGHDTALGKEYKQLIQTWIQLKGTQTPLVPITSSPSPSTLPTAKPLLGANS